MTFVYVIGVERSPVKVGKAVDLDQRLAGLQIGCPDKLIVHYSVFVRPKFMSRVEAGAHAILKEHHRHGEWFNVDADVAHAAILKVLPDSVEERLREIAEVEDELNNLMPGYEVGMTARSAINQFRIWHSEERTKSKWLPVLAYIGRKCGPETAKEFISFIILRTPLDGIDRLNPGAGRSIRRRCFHAIEALVDYWHEAAQAA